MAVRAVRGATTCENTMESVFAAVEELLGEIIRANDILIPDMADIIFTVTSDIDKVFPAAAVRSMGIVNVPLLDMAAPDIENALKSCIRIMVHINTGKTNDDLKHIYLRGAKSLRPDLAGK